MKNEKIAMNLDSLLWCQASDPDSGFALLHSLSRRMIPRRLYQASLLFGEAWYYE